MGVRLYDYQLKAVEQMKNGCILCGGVGSGKSRTSLAYYYIQQGGEIDEDPTPDNVYIPMKNPKDLYIITTARKRDTLEWNYELTPFLMSTDKETNYYDNKIVIDSWNNIRKYIDVENAFFIFDEQRVVGSGKWVESFLKISKKNDWILLSATPGDTWLDYIPVFVANGFYKNPTQFKREHVIYSRYCRNFPKVEGYMNVNRLIRLRKRILVDMDYNRDRELINEDIILPYDMAEYKELIKTRWNKEKEEPIQNASELCYQMRKIVNSDPSRIQTIKDIIKEKQKVIIFYNFDYELELLKSAEYYIDDNKVEIAEWNGHKHQPIPNTDYWIYLVQYNAGAEGWNCIKTDTIIFYSQNYSYKVMVQSSGRIDRLNTPYKKLYYYHLKSKSGIDLAISKALKEKRKFNESKFVNW